jgi:hypothetical protein
MCTVLPLAECALFVLVCALFMLARALLSPVCTRFE